MIVTTRLLTTSSVVSAVVSRNVHITAFQRDFKIFNAKDSSTLRRTILRESSKISSSYYSNSQSSGRRDGPINFQCEKSDAQMVSFVKICELLKGSTENSEHVDLTSERNDLRGIDDDATMGRNKRYKGSLTKQKYKSIRPWQPVGSAAALASSERDFVVKILSYNILAQNLLETHGYIYLSHNREALNWQRRMILVQQEIMEAEANVICIQEMLDDHLEEFLAVFKKSGYDYIYKKRTNDKKDGLLLLYRADQLKLVDHAEVEFYQANISILNRDNVGIAAKFSLIESPDTQIVVSTTHLLYNPKREDVRLAQTQLLLSELERLAFIELTKKGPRYHPILLCGDFNLQPRSGVYRFITEGAFQFRGRGRNLEPALLCGLGNSLIPPSLLITDNCQNYDALIKRLRGKNEDATKLNKFDGTDDRSDASEQSNDESENKDKVDTNTLEYQNVKIAEGQYAEFSSGSLTHPLSFNSLYQHVDSNGQMEATTHQGKWITVDYIFYDGLEPLSKYNLPTVSECKQLPTIPNSVVGSDHLCLGASFKLKKIKR